MGADRGRSMIGDFVEIEIPPEASEMDAKRAEGACEAALGVGHCEVGHGELVDFVPQWTADVSRQPEGGLLIELRATGDGVPALTRHLNFAAEDPDAFRFQSVGVVVAAMVLAQSPVEGTGDSPANVETGDPQVTPASTEDADVALAPPERSLRRQEANIAIDAAATVTSGLAANRPGMGGMGAVVWSLPVPLLIVADMEVTARRRRISEVRLASTAFTASIGLGERLIFSGGDLGVEGQLGANVQALRLSAEDNLGEQANVTMRWGGGVSLRGFFRFHPRWGVVLGGKVGALAPAISLQVQGTELAQLSPIWWGTFVGLRCWVLP